MTSTGQITHQDSFGIHSMNPEFFFEKNCWRRRIKSNIILPAAHKFLPAVHKNLACVINSPRRTLQEASSRNLLDFSQKNLGQALLSFAVQWFYLTRTVSVTMTVANKQNIESPSDVHMCKVSTPQWSSTLIYLSSQTRQSAQCSTGPTLFDKKRVNWWY